MQLTTKRVAMFAKRPGRYHDGHGLILVVVNPNNASWQLRYQRNGRERWLGLGPLHTVTLKDARERARAARLKLRLDSGLKLYFGPLMSDKIRYVPVAKPVLVPGV